MRFRRRGRVLSFGTGRRLRCGRRDLRLCWSAW